MSLDFHRAWDLEEDALALKMRAEGRTLREIAEELGRSVNAVKARLDKLDAHRRSDEKR